MVRLYSPEPIAKIASASRDAEKIGLVVSLLRNIHLAAAAEAISFASFLQADMAQFYELVNAAAGGTAMFRSRGPEMIALSATASSSSSSSIKPAVNGTAAASESSRTLDDAVEELAVVVQRAREVNCPLHLGNAVLSILLAAKRRGYGGLSDSHVIRMWEGVGSA
ncbi:hypothetical protein VTO42DRAFT_7606 [Malbranchea cinnamomea]